MVKIDTFDLPEEFYYKQIDHVWVKILDPKKVVLGLDDFGQQLTGRIQNIDTYPAGMEIKKGKTFCTIESGKYVGPVKSPISGRIVEINEEVMKKPRLINESCYEHWILVVEPFNLEEDLADLIKGGKAIRSWIQDEIQDYKERGYL
ncbi:MAG: glycine cleavage system protein H [Candidatus Wukongarchaeota archaeon]|nr:glycine cleavage system protein H [Candidatus Wukongarchaeota archaeon]